MSDYMEYNLTEQDERAVFQSRPHSNYQQSVEPSTGLILCRLDFICLSIWLDFLLSKIWIMDRRKTRFIVLRSDVFGYINFMEFAPFDDEAQDQQRGLKQNCFAGPHSKIHFKQRL
ncbi:uncharacterized protein N7500_002350 [Penicillium coprophilum]|uniref:uncharacterized protein n=1 Tax=Penicillium coprophilum TaxID=36646 RepID=UPI00239ECA2C|nr:uncharacterized protein N7500_002350 [Penicillium coprophilum]KAJ5169567.1 hypothetical protein N7500_002350 [Penicillium coprophilum]